MHHRAAGLDADCLPGYRRQICNLQYWQSSRAQCDLQAVAEEPNNVVRRQVAFTVILFIGGDGKNLDSINCYEANFAEQRCFGVTELNYGLSIRVQRCRGCWMPWLQPPQEPQCGVQEFRLRCSSTLAIPVVPVAAKRLDARTSVINRGASQHGRNGLFGVGSEKLTHQNIGLRCPVLRTMKNQFFNRLG